MTTQDDGRCPSGPGSQASPGAASASPPPVSIPIAFTGATMIKQQSEKDCFMCCLAMALGLTHEQVTRGMDEFDAGLAARVLAKGCYDKDVAATFAALGLRQDQDYLRIFILPEYASTGFIRNVLWGRRACIQVRSKNYAGEMHIVYWDGVALFDPSNKRTYEWNEVEPIYLWLFNERRFAQGIVTEGQDPKGLGEREARVEPGPKDAPKFEYRASLNDLAQSGERNVSADWPIGETRVVQLWPHDEPLPEGAAHGEPPVVTDHHLHHAIIVTWAGRRALKKYRSVYSDEPPDAA